MHYLIDKKLFYEKIFPKLKIPKNTYLNEDILFILFFSIKLVIIIQNIENNIYSNFHSNNLISFLSNNYIPGALSENNIELIETYQEIEDHLRNSNEGVYMCSCGKCYYVGNCTFPTQTSNCNKCGSPIGGTKHILVRRPGHFRIILREKKSEIIDHGYDKSMPYKILDDFKRNFIDSKINQDFKGIGKMNELVITKIRNNTRNINELPFRIMNFIIYSQLLISNILEILNDNQIQYFFEGTSCFNILMINWNKMQELLNQIGINNIKAFMNVIFERIIQIISKFNLIDKFKFNSIDTVEKRNQIENEFNLIMYDLNNIKQEIKIYEEQNQQILNSSPFNISSLIQQLYPIEFYQNEEPFPDFKYLYLYSYPSYSKVFSYINSNNDLKYKYPLTYKVLEYFENQEFNTNKISLLEYIPKVNKKINYLIDNYSYKISREEASNKTIKEEFNKKENNLFIINNLKNKENLEQYNSDLYNLFKAFQNIDLQWGCHRLNKIVINSDSSLSSILLDDNEPGYYLASIYKKLIEYQNTFLDNIINCNAQSGILNCFVKQLKNEIMIQDATFNEIIKINPFENINNKNNNKSYSSLDELIFVNTSNDPYNNVFNYELDQIEAELGNLILSGVRKFKSSNDELKFITYMYEGYRGKNSNILTNFNEKYPPKDLAPNEKNILISFIHKFNQNEYKTFLFFIQLLISYIQKSGRQKDTTPISDIINDKNLPKYFNIDSNIKSLFNDNKSFTNNKLVRIFEFFESLCWEQIKENLLDEYMKPLDEQKFKLIEKYYKQNNENKYYIKKAELAGAIRKFISRYLAGKRSQSEIGEDKMLFDYLIRVDLWERNIDDDNFQKEFDKLSKFKFTVGEGKDLHEKLVNNKDPINRKDKNEIIIGNNEEKDVIRKIKKIN